MSWRASTLKNNAFTDVTVFEVLEPLTHETDLCVMDLVTYASGLDREPAIGDDVLASGYPVAGLDNEIDYETGMVSRQRFCAQGEYVGPADSRCVHTVRFGMGKVKTMNGRVGRP